MKKMLLIVDGEVQGFTEEFSKLNELISRVIGELDDDVESITIKKRAPVKNSQNTKPKQEVKSSRIEIKTSKLGCGFTEIYVDGHRLRGVRSYELKHHVNNVPVLTLELNALDIAVDQEVLMFAEGFGEIEIKFKEPSEESSLD